LRLEKESWRKLFSAWGEGNVFGKEEPWCATLCVEPLMCLAFDKEENAKHLTFWVAESAAVAAGGVNA
jgi:hypothetical protein